MRRLLKAMFSRVTITVLLLAIEIALIVMLTMQVGKYAAWISVFLRIACIFVVLYINMTTEHLSFDLIWMLAVLIFPVAGTALYLMLGTNLFTTSTYRNLVANERMAARYYDKGEEVREEMYAKDPARTGQFRYICEGAGYPFYKNEGFDYYRFGEDGFPAMLEELRKAEKFIFIEYFIIEPGEMWDSIMEILEEKAAAGVDVRIIYDDMGSFSTLPLSYGKKLAKKNIRCEAFNRISLLLAKIMNHRDHRKIMVIDGKVAFSGGINLADEYINKVEKYGVWKDNTFRVKGKAVWSYTVLFLSHWYAITMDDEDYTKFRVEDADENDGSVETDGYIAAYGETPLDNEITSQNIYMNILNQANDYCYIFTPYLIIDSELQNALILAAKRGVDVRLITPGIPDKKRIWRITRSFYPSLIRGGVKIYEYQPGFVHAKVFVSDDKIATVGTINLDYRSLYLHFENGTYLYDSSKVLEIRDDFLDTNEECKLMTVKDIKLTPFGRFKISVLRLFAPLL